jgi:ankyrin repeat protein
VLLEHGATVDIASTDGDTPLHLAAAYGWAAVVELLLLAGSPPDAPRPRLHDDEAPATALAVAVYNRQVGAAR